MLRPVHLLSAWALLTPAAAAAAAQPGFDGANRGPAARATSTGDSLAIVRAARSAQAGFERTRRRYLPFRHGAPSGPCGEIIGRFCYWDDDSTDDVLVRDVPPRESPRIGAARDRLLAILDSTGRAVPGDAWIAGLHVHYLIEAGRLDQARDRALACGAEPWWCSALEGLVEHVAWRYAEADSAFSRALGAMPQELRCDWMNLEVLLDEPTLTPYKRADCAGRAPLDDRIWWLADPSWLRAGNDRRTEHFARVTRARIHRGAASGYATTWRDDLDEIVRRFGWPSHFAQESPPAYRTDGPRVSAYHDSPSYHFIANVAPLAELGALTDSSWALRPVQPRERHAPAWGTIGRLTYLSTLFRRGDSALLVVAYDASSDSLLRLGAVTAAVVAAAGPSASERRMVRHAAPTKGTLMLTLPDTSLVASAELLSGARMVRARFGVPGGGPRRSLRMSELAFFDPADSLPSDLETFLPLARTTSKVRAGSKLGLFWELYGAPSSDDDMALDVRIAREGESWLRRAGERIGLVSAPPRVGFGWRESRRSDGITARAVVVDLGGLDPGTYRIELTLTPHGETPLVASRRIEITR